MKAFEKLDDNTVVLNAVNVNKETNVMFILEGVLVDGLVKNQFIDTDNSLLLNVKYHDILCAVRPEDAFETQELYEAGYSLANKLIGLSCPNAGEMFNMNTFYIEFKKFTWNEAANKPIENLASCSNFNVCNGQYTICPTIFSDEYLSWEECVKWNDYKVREYDNEFVNKSANKHTLLTESQKELVEEFISLMKKMKEEDIAIIINSNKEEMNFYNTKEYCVYPEYDCLNEEVQIPIDHGKKLVKTTYPLFAWYDEYSAKIVAEEKKVN